MLFDFAIKDNIKILEPSAGIGNLADAIKAKNPSVKIDCIELNKNSCNTLKEKGYITIRTDFLEYTPRKLYDAVIAAPTFKNNIDIEHIMHMYDFIHNNGTIISLTSPYWLTGNQDNQIKFREWLKDKNYSLKMLPDNSFIEKYKTVPTAVITIKK
jgi:hypothetical protein